MEDFDRPPFFVDCQNSTHHQSAILVLQRTQKVRIAILAIGGHNIQHVFQVCPILAELLDLSNAHLSGGHA